MMDDIPDKDIIHTFLDNCKYLKIIIKYYIFPDLLFLSFVNEILLQIEFRNLEETLNSN